MEIVALLVIWGITWAVKDAVLEFPGVVAAAWRGESRPSRSQRKAQKARDPKAGFNAGSHVGQTSAGFVRGVGSGVKAAWGGGYTAGIDRGGKALGVDTKEQRKAGSRWLGREPQEPKGDTWIRDPAPERIDDGPGPLTPPAPIPDAHTDRPPVPEPVDTDPHSPAGPSLRFDGEPETDADRRFFDLRESGYTGPINQDGYADTTSEDAQTLRRMAEARGEEVDWADQPAEPAPQPEGDHVADGACPKGLNHPQCETCQTMQATPDTPPADAAPEQLATVIPIRPRPTFQGGAMSDDRPTAELGGIEQARNFFDGMADAYEADISNCEMAMGALAGSNVDGDTLGALSRASEASSNAAAAHREARDALDEHNRLSEEAANTEHEAADREFLVHQ